MGQLGAGVQAEQRQVTGKGVRLAQGGTGGEMGRAKGHEGGGNKRQGSAPP